MNEHEEWYFVGRFFGANDQLECEVKISFYSFGYKDGKAYGWELWKSLDGKGSSAGYVSGKKYSFKTLKEAATAGRNAAVDYMKSKDIECAGSFEPWNPMMGFDK